MGSSRVNVDLRALAFSAVLLATSCATSPNSAQSSRLPNADDACYARPVLGSHIRKKACSGEAGSEQGALNSWELQRSEQTQVRPEQ